MAQQERSDTAMRDDRDVSPVRRTGEHVLMVATMRPINWIITCWLVTNSGVRHRTGAGFTLRGQGVNITLRRPASALPGSAAA